MELKSFKLRLAAEHVRIVPKLDEHGCPFAGPGVDLRGEEAAAIFAAARPLVEALTALEPGVVVRSIAVDLGRPRVTATLDPATPGADPRARVVRIDEGTILRGLMDAASAVTTLLGAAAERALAARDRRGAEGS